MSYNPYQSSVPTNGGTVSPVDWCEDYTLNPAGTLATLTVNFPAQPKDGQPFSLRSSQVITALTMASTSTPAQTILWTATTLSIGLNVRWVFNGPANTWQ